MNHRKIVLFLGVAAAVTAFSVAQRPPRRPNLLIIIADQWRGQALGFEGKDPVLTPNLDRFARESLVLEQMVSNYPVCSPARAMLMSGVFPFRNHVYSNVNSESAPFDVELPATITCWSDVLKGQGYSNGYIGKWHLDAPHKPYVPTYNNLGSVAWNEWTPPSRRHGFDYWYAYGTYDEHDKPMYWDTYASRDSFHYVHQWGPIHEADKAIAFMKDKGQGGPFSLVVSMNPPHSVYNTAPDKYYRLYKNIPLDSLTKDPDIPPAGTPMGDAYRRDVRYYYASITGVDDQIGRILQALKDQGLDDNTIVVFMADHGNCLGKHDEISKNNLYEESLRIPFLISWKGHILPRLDSTFLGSIPDIYPTLLDLMGLKKDIPSGLDGKSYASYFLTGRGEMPKVQYLMGAVSANNKSSGFRGVRTTDYVLAYARARDTVRPYLFDLKNDPFELTNLYKPDQVQVRRLLPVLKAWLKRTGDPFVNRVP